MYFLSSAEGARWAEIATQMTERILKLGPNPLKNDHNGRARAIKPEIERTEYKS